MGKGVKLWGKIKPNNQNLLNVHTIQQPDLIGLEQRSIEFENENINNTCSSQGNAYKLLPKFFWHRIQYSISPILLPTIILTLSITITSVHVTGLEIDCL